LISVLRSEAVKKYQKKSPIELVAMKKILNFSTKMIY